VQPSEVVTKKLATGGRILVKITQEGFCEETTDLCGGRVCVNFMLDEALLEVAAELNKGDLVK
jgi:hypothetical protein